MLRWHMSYKNYSKDDLIKKIHKLEDTKQKELDKRDELIESQYSATGYLGPWLWNVKNDVITLNPVQNKMFKLNSSKKISFDDFMEFVHEDDQEFVRREFDGHIQGKITVVEIEYRVLFNDDRYHWLYHRAEIDETDSSNQPLHVMGIIMDITEKRKTEEYLNKKKELHEKNATLDFLTNLLNRRGLHAHTSRYLRGTHSTNKTISIAMFDIDYFKQANDTYGHEYGDEVLFDIANLLKENTRDEDIVSRFGGDEFLLILMDSELNTAYKICERIRKAVQYKYENNEVKITLSGGVYESHDEDVNALIKKVDDLLYQAKKNGRNKIIKGSISEKD